jgi:hypothetical protein
MAQRRSADGIADRFHKRSTVAEANVVTWDIGGNDLAGARTRYLEGSCGGSDNQQCLRDAVEQFRSNWDSII